jgi:hypothetical protein
METTDELAFDLDDLPVDVFELEDAGLFVESLTDGHGVPGLTLSSSACACPCLCSCAGAP